MNRLRRSEPGDSASPAPASPGAAHRGARSDWLMLAGAFTAFTVSAAMMHSYTVFLVAFIEDFGWSRAETSIAYSVSQLVAGAQLAAGRRAGRSARAAAAAAARRRRCWCSGLSAAPTCRAVADHRCSTAW